MDQVLSLRPFVPARDHAASTRFYETLGFATKPPAMQPWGLKARFLHDPAGVLRHVAEAPF